MIWGAQTQFIHGALRDKYLNPEINTKTKKLKDKCSGDLKPSSFADHEGTNISILKLIQRLKDKMF